MAKQALILTNGKTLIDWSLDHDYSQDGPEIYRPADHTIITDDFTPLPSDWAQFAWVWNSTTLEFDKTQDYCSCILAKTTISVAGPTNDVDISGINVLFMDTSSNDVTVGGFIGGVEGQVLFAVKTNSANSAKLENNENGNTQKIFLCSGFDDTISNYGGWILYCNGSHWYEIRGA